MKRKQKNRQKRINVSYGIETEILQKNIVTFNKRFLKPTNPIRPEDTRQFDVKILSTIIDNVHFVNVK